MSLSEFFRNFSYIYFFLLLLALYNINYQIFMLSKKHYICMKINPNKGRASLTLGKHIFLWKAQHRNHM